MSKKADIWSSQGIYHSCCLTFNNSTKKPKETGEFFLNIYFSEGEEVKGEESFINFNATYVNPFPGEPENRH